MTPWKLPQHVYKPRRDSPSFPEVSAVRSDWLTSLNLSGEGALPRKITAPPSPSPYLFYYYYSSVADSVCVGATVHVRVSQRCSASLFLFFFSFSLLTVRRRVLAPPIVFPLNSRVCLFPGDSPQMAWISAGVFGAKVTDLMDLGGK